MSTADQLLSARIAAVARRHTRRGEVDDLDQAVAELQEVAGDRHDLLAEHAGVSAGWA
jgi:acetyl-CoA carboxylase alpha subunit